MNAPAIVKPVGRPLGVWLLVLLLVLGPSPAALAGDPDDDWGLPKTAGDSNGSTPAEDRDDGNQASTLLGDVGAYAELQVGLAKLDLPRVELDRVEHEGTSIQSVDTAEAADLLALDAGAPLRVELLGDGLRLQGSAALRPSSSLSATLRGPAVGVGIAYLVLDRDAPSLDALLAGAAAGAIPVAVVAHEALGPLDSLELPALHALAVEHAQLLAAADVSHVSIVVGTLGFDGQLHLSGVRVPAGGGDLEIVIR